MVDHLGWKIKYKNKIFLLFLPGLWRTTLWRGRVSASNLTPGPLFIRLSHQKGAAAIGRLCVSPIGIQNPTV